ncbi:MAG: imidazoleglycerol-phosphate dehydratase HisB [Planctomycetota bacterium]|jgi:imidazoleglycerol phosphate dehydratase HisB
MTPDLTPPPTDAPAGQAPLATATAAPANRRAQVERATRETRIELRLDLDGSGAADVSTGLGFLDHMLESLTLFSRFDLRLRVEGDLQVDDHHTVEDVALSLGRAVDEAIGERRGLRRFGQAYAPLDEALVRCVLDVSSRPFARVNLGFRRERLGDVATENLTHFFQSFATAARLTLHLDLLEGENDHHKCEAAFKACALALRSALELDPRGQAAVPSAKGVLE